MIYLGNKVNLCYIQSEVYYLHDVYYSCTNLVHSIVLQQQWIWAIHDTVNHDILIRKLDQYGIRGIALDWFKNYLCNRKQFVCYNTAISMDQYISCGVPQGSVLGPLLFLISINDICNTSEIISFCLFADDTSLLYDHNDINTGIKILNTELVKITTWLSSNKLSVNLLKTNYIIFSSGNHEVSQAVPLVLFFNNFQTPTFWV